MTDDAILDLYFSRSPQAIPAAAEKYGAYCRAIAGNILPSAEDAEECVNDAYLRSWEAIPPHRPERLSAFLGKITRNLSLTRLSRLSAKKRGSGEVPLALLELQECVPAPDTPESALDEKLLTQALTDFLRAQKPRERTVFLKRYWYLCSIPAIARQTGLSESNVKVILHRTRQALRDYLREEGIDL